MSERPNVVELEQQLREDPNGNAKRQVADKLAGYRQEVKNMLNQSHDGPTHEALQKLFRGIEQAEVVVESYWAANNTL